MQLGWLGAQTICACTCAGLTIFLIMWKWYIGKMYLSLCRMCMRNKMFIKIAQSPQLYVKIIAIREICKIFVRCLVTSQSLLAHSTFMELRTILAKCKKCVGFCSNKHFINNAVMLRDYMAEVIATYWIPYMLTQYRN